MTDYELQRRMVDLAIEMQTQLKQAQADTRQLERILTGFHTDSICGSCEGPLEEHRDAICERCTQRNEIEQLQFIIREHLEHSADGVLLCTYNGPLHCPKCGGVVREEYDCCYCESCPNPDDYGEPPLPLFNSNCFVDAAKASGATR